MQSFFTESEENCEFALKYLSSQTTAAEEFDIYCIQCAYVWFKQITVSKSTTEILELWPEYTKPFGARW